MESVTWHIEKRSEAFVDGNDFGRGVFNLFILTNKPAEAFLVAEESIQKHRPDLKFTAGYRDFDEDYYTALWPPSLKTFRLS